MAEVVSPLRGAVVRVVTAPGERVESSSPVVVVESMKMEYVVEAGVAGTVGHNPGAAGDPVQAGGVLPPGGAPAPRSPRPPPTPPPPPNHAGVRPVLVGGFPRHAAGRDAARPDAVARRR